MLDYTIWGGSSVATILQVEILRTYHRKMSYRSFSCYHISGRNDKDSSLKNVLAQIVYCTKINVSLYHKGRQFSCHLITGNNIKDLSLENVLP